MSEYLPSYENIDKYLTVKEVGETSFRTIKNKLKAGLSLAFLVTDNFEIYIGTTGEHKDIYSRFPYGYHIIEKGKISGSQRKIHWVTSDSQKPTNIDAKDLAKVQSAIRQKINDYLDFDYYFQ